MVQSLQEIVWQFLKNLNIELSLKNNKVSCSVVSDSL